ncbi:Acyl carrier protein [Apiospora arundinis]
MTWWRVQQVDPDVIRQVRAAPDAHEHNLVVLMVYAFMAYGAPPHRIEEYAHQLIKACRLEGRAKYTVGCTELCFVSPPYTGITYTNLVAATERLDVGACEFAFTVFQHVVRGDISIPEANTALIRLIEEGPYYNPWFLVVVHGLLSASLSWLVAVGGWLDMLVSFVLGCIVGVSRIMLAPHWPKHSVNFSALAAVLTTFIAGAFASIGGPGQSYFCFSAIAISSILTLVPGFPIITGMLELNAQSLGGVARLSYAVVHSLTLCLGINVGSQLSKLIRDDSQREICSVAHGIDARWKFLLVPIAMLFMAILAHSRPRQMPKQIILGYVAHIVLYFLHQHPHATSQISATVSGFVLGGMANIIGRIQHSEYPFGAVIPGVLVLIPLAAIVTDGVRASIMMPLWNNETMNAQMVFDQNIAHSFFVAARIIEDAVGLALGLSLSMVV